jgi:DMSO/TMAO reductase YedYZ molybdopterin-dependent catalytic subunit
VDVEAQRAAIVLPPLATPTPPATTPAAPSSTPEAAVEPVDVEGVSPIITPNADFYRIDTAFVVPSVDVTGWRLTVKGMVDRPFDLTFDELVAMPAIEQSVTLSCVSNEVGGDLVGNALWRGVLLPDVLARAGVQPGATQVIGRSVDGFTVGFPTDVALDGRTSMVAYAMNGEPLPAVHGFPARLVVPGLYGYVSATKWLREIELTTFDAFDAYWIPRGWSKLGPIKTQSRIDTPNGGRNVTAGRVAIAGVAWGGVRGISKVEVRVTPQGSSEATWHTARLGEALSSSSWRQWVVEDWMPQPGVYQLAVRATDGTGAAQTEDRRPPAPDGATGLHTVSVRVRAA